jgi:hypothetical protein
VNQLPTWAYPRRLSCSYVLVGGSAGTPARGAGLSYRLPLPRRLSRFKRCTYVRTYAGGQLLGRIVNPVQANFRSYIFIDGGAAAPVAVAPCYRARGLPEAEPQPVNFK